MPKIVVVDVVVDVVADKKRVVGNICLTKFGGGGFLKIHC
tara:strand:- start:2028 stop:2147 length:120 start_codon:yes stop_codon:yes gene_type:complete